MGKTPASGETRSFGETHASELTTIASVTAEHGHDVPGATAPHDASAPINPAVLNNTPATIPHYNAPAAPPAGGHYAPPGGSPPVAHATLPHDAPSSASVPKAPTVAETGVPVSAGAAGPGPATGSLSTEKDEVVDRPAVGYGVGTGPAGDPPGYIAPPAPLSQTAADEKGRLAAVHANDVPVTGSGHQGGLVASTSTRRPETHESAEDEKKRLEREERERTLRGNTTDTQSPSDDAPAPPPAYQD